MNIEDTWQFKIRKRDPQYICALLRKLEPDSKEVFLIINSCTSQVLTQTTIKLAVQKGYFIRNNTPNEIKSNPQIVKEILENTKEKLKINSTIRYSHNESLTEENILLAIQKGYILNENSPAIIKKNPKAITNMLSLAKIPYDVKNIINNSDSSALTEEILKTAIQKGYYLDKDAPDNLKKDAQKLQIILSNLKEEYTVRRTIESCHIGALTTENILLAVKLGYYVNEDTPPQIKDNPDIVYYLIQFTTNYTQMKTTIDNMGKSCYTDKNLALALQKDYQISSTGNQIAKNNPNIIAKFLKMISEKEKIKRLIDNCEITALTAENVLLAIQKGYYLNKRTKKEIASNPNYLIALLNQSRNSLEVRNTILYAKDEALTQPVISLAYQKGFYSKKEDPPKVGIHPDFSYQTQAAKLKLLLTNITDSDSAIDLILTCEKSALTAEILQDMFFKYSIVQYLTVEKLNEVTKPYINIQQISASTTYQKQLQKAISELGYAAIFFYKNDLFSEYAMECLPFLVISKIYRYLYLTGKKAPITSLIQAHKLHSFLTFYQEVLRESLDHFNVRFFESACAKYQKYYHLIKESNTPQEKEKLKQLFNWNYEDIPIAEKQDLENLENNIFIFNKNILDTVSNIEKIKNTICLLLCNQSYKEIEKIITEVINSEKINHLCCSLKDKTILELLKEYIPIIAFLEYIIKSSDIEELREIGTQLNQMFLEEKEQFHSTFSILVGIENTMKQIYAIEANQNLTQVKILTNSPSVSIEKDKYGENIDYIDIKGEFYFLMHTMNAFGKYSKISDWKHPRLVGKPFISLSSISQEKIGVQRVPESIDDVTVIFDNIYPTSFLKMAQKDAFSYSASWNDLNVDSKYCNFDTLKETLKETESYNEYVVYRENDDGSYLYPTAILVTQDFPNEAEIAAGKYLQVPLVKVQYLSKQEKMAQVEKKQSNIDSSNQEAEPILDLLGFPSSNKSVKNK